VSHKGPGELTALPRAHDAIAGFSGAPEGRRGEREEGK